MLLFGGGGFYCWAAPVYGGSGVGLILLIIIIVFLALAAFRGQSHNRINTTSALASGVCRVINTCRNANCRMGRRCNLKNSFSAA